jgi:spore germination protein
MKPFDYADEKIEGKELAFSVASMMLGVGILTLPRLVAESTIGSGGIISILMAGLFFISFGWLTAKVVSKFPQQNIYQYLTKTVSKYAAIILVLGLSLSFLLATALEARVIGNITKFYFFDRTPTEVLSFVFLLVVIYGVAGSRVALLRLNIMFFPIVLLIVVAVQLFNINFFELNNIKPMFASSAAQYFDGANETTLSFVGYVIVLVYISLLRNPEKAPKMTVIGMSLPLGIYLLIYLFCLGVFANAVTANITYPTIEIAKEVEVPGKFFERFESIFFTIWVMTIFTTAAMAYDAAVYCLQTLFPKVKKIKWIIALAPIIYVVSMAPKDAIELHNLGKFIAVLGFFYGVIMPLLLFLVIKLRRL